MTSTIPGAAHPVTAFVAGLHSALDNVSGTPAWSMTPPDLAAAVVDLHREQARLVELELRLVAQAKCDGLGSEIGAADTKAWWANTTRQTRRDATRRLALAEALDQRDVLHEAMKAGHVAEDQATVIVRALDALPDDVGADVVKLAEKELVRLAGFHDALDLTRLGKRILDVVAPEVGQAQLKAALEREEERAAKACRFTIADDGHGQCHGRFTLPTATGAMLKKHLLALAAPKRQPAGSGGRAAIAEDGGRAASAASDVETHVETPLAPRPSAERLGQAFREYVERYPTDRTPHAGGVNATVTVTMTYADFTADTDAPAYMDTGEQITAGEARRLACEAGVIPVVLGGAGPPLDVGRTKRFHTPAQRVAIALRDKTCTAEGCDWPPGMCHVHHDKPWSHGGPTSIDNGRLLCPNHHRMAHQSRYTMKAIKNGRVIFSRT